MFLMVTHFIFLVERDEMKGEEKNWLVFVVSISKYYINRKLGRESQPTFGFINNGPHFTIRRKKESRHIW